MCKYLLALLFLIPVVCPSKAQWVTNDSISGSSIQADSSLKEVVVISFNKGALWKDIPAAIAPINPKEIALPGNTGFLPLVNNVSGVRMEERSPGSYRFSIRGSLLRSPFGIRNVKVYWNEIPLTDATGNTYLNLLDIQQLNSIEIAKGPSSSNYGAGTGGVILLNRYMPYSEKTVDHYTLSVSSGSFGLNRQLGEWEHHSKNFSTVLQANRMQSEGYREQSSLLKSGLVWQTAAKFDKQELQTFLFYTNLNYATPGGITKEQMQLNPRLSRQPTSTLPGAVQQKAAVYNQTVFGAIRYNRYFSSTSQLNSFLSVGGTGFSNPFITNYEKRRELNLNIGLQIHSTPFRSLPALRWTNAMEWMINESGIKNFTNKNGQAGSLIADDIIYAAQGFISTQLNWKLTEKLTLNAGFSSNVQTYSYKRLSDLSGVFFNKKVKAPFVSRLALSYRLNQDLNVYAIVADGFSFPGLAELRPSDGNFHPMLNAEKGRNLEAGFRGKLFQQKLSFDIAGYYFKLKNAIVKRMDNAGAEYFVNAGETLQPGAEVSVRYVAFQHKTSFIRMLTLSGAFTWQPYRFTQYMQGATDYSGNHLTGIPATVLVAGINIAAKQDWYITGNLNLTSSIPLNDAGTVWADKYSLLQAQIGKKLNWNRNKLDIYAGADNLLNQLYSLGNDLNAAGGRYFNPAPERNWVAGFRFCFQ